MDLDLVVVGGCGHVGLPLAIAFAEVGCRVGIYDRDAKKIDQVARGEMPFYERGGAAALKRTREQLELSTEPSILARADNVMVVIGTEVDEFLNPSLRTFDRAILEIEPHLRTGALVALRSTVYPGTTRRLDTKMVAHPVAYCPERSVQGLALEGIRTLPQIVGTDDPLAHKRAVWLFDLLGVETVALTTVEAELAKLYTNAWRYTWFAIGNEFYEMSNRAGVDHDRVLGAVRHNYPRATELPGPGFTAGPCLMKDTMQLAAFDGQFLLGHAAQRVNEGLPDHLVRGLVEEYGGSLEGRRVALLGMAFKAESDDTRDSLSYKLQRLLWFAGARVQCSDPYVQDAEVLLDHRMIVDRAEIVIVCVPHPEYKGLTLRPNQRLIDPWRVAA